MLLLVQSPLEGQNEMDEFVTSSTSAMQGDLAQPRIKMLELLDFIGFYNEEPRPPQPPRFIRLDPASYTRPLPAHRELQLIDLTAMHRDMVLLLQRAENENIYSMQQLQQMQQEIKDTLTHALQRNKWRCVFLFCCSSYHSFNDPFFFFFFLVPFTMQRCSCFLLGINSLPCASLCATRNFAHSRSARRSSTP